MSGGPVTGVVVDTMVISWLVDDRPEDLAGGYRDLIGASPVLLQPDDAMITVCADLRQRCRLAGHALADKSHDGDRWIAATAIRLGLSLVSRDGVFAAAPGLDLLTIGRRR